MFEKSTILEVNESWEGYAPVHGRRPANYNSRVAAIVDLIENVSGYSTRMWQARLEEAMGTADFPTLFGDVLQREMLANYQAQSKQMRTILRTASINDFRTVRRTRGEGDYTGRLQQVEEGGEYKARKKAPVHFTYKLKKFGSIIPLFWEAWLNDADGFFKDLAEGLATSASNTEEFLLTSLFWDSAGPIDSYFNHASIGQKGVSALPLSNANLQTAIHEMMGSGATSGFRDLNGEPILNAPRYLMVPPSLMLTAREILHNAQLIPVGVPTSAIVVQTSHNVIADFDLQLIVNPWIPVVVTTGSIGQTTWGLFSSTISPGEVGNLRGRTEPEIFLRASNAVAVAGGADASTFGGHFEDDSIRYKVRMVQGETRLDQRGGWASDGQ